MNGRLKSYMQMKRYALRDLRRVKNIVYAPPGYFGDSSHRHIVTFDESCDFTKEMWDATPTIDPTHS